MTRAEHSRFLQRLLRRYDPDLGLMPQRAPLRQDMEQALAQLVQRPLPLGEALRTVRQLVLARLVQTDCTGQASLQDVTRSMTELAEWALDHACRQAFAELDDLHGQPVREDGSRARLWVVGMGKLGARELNVSSDIDLIYVYDEDGETAGNSEGRLRISNHEYFGKAVKRVYQLIGDTTENGFVFRVDLMLRPNGNSGPPAVSLGALEDYFLVQGREWERFAWLKSRVVAPQASLADGSALALRSVVLPFVFRRYLDYSVFEGLRDLHRQIREHSSRRSAGHPERANDVKLSRGGIREIEFIVQLLQVVRGGQFPELRKRPTLQALQVLSRAGIMPAASAEFLADAYTFLRQVEHRIQYLDDQQTHVLPTQDDDLAWMAATLNFADTCAFLAELDRFREGVAHEFDTLLGADDGRSCKGCCGGKPGADTGPGEAGMDLPAALPALFKQRLQDWQNHPRVLALREQARQRLVRLVQRTAQWLLQGRTTETAALRMADWLEPLLRRESYLALLLERPAVHERLLHMLGAARWPARYMQQHPGVIDELASGAMLAERFDTEQFRTELEQRRLALQSSGEDDDESLLNLLRRAHHAEVFRILARDVEGRLSVEQVADDLSALADAVLASTSQWCWQRLKLRHQEAPSMGIIAYGKLGGKELGYGSDLDIVFVYDDPHESALEIYGAFIRKLITWLTLKTGEGDLFEIDTALRPNGSSGLLITSFESYANYQQQRGSNTAWTWEHQAMTRARFCLGRPELGQRFDAVRQAVITAPRDAQALRQEVATMRQRVASAHPVKPDKFDVKHSPGGMVDAEFAVQYLVLTQSHAHPELRANVGNIALLQRAEQAGLLPPGLGTQAANAYRHLRQVQHHARLNEESTQVEPGLVAEQARVIREVWGVVVGGN